MSKIAVAAALIGSFGVGAVPRSVEAGFFSFIRGMQEKRETKPNSSSNSFTAIDRPNSQTMNLLQAPRNVNPGSIAQGGGDIFIIGNEALSPGSRSDGPDRDDVSDDRGRIREYVVREGDSLSRIAEMFDVSVNTIRWSNDIGANGNIRIGQKLIILPITGIQYVVESGDSLSTIAEEFGGDVDEIREFNRLNDDDVLLIGDEVIIPNGEIKQSPQRSGTPSAPAPRAPRTNPAPSSGYYAHPAPGAIVTQRTHGYNGIDFGAGYGTPIVASARGTVIISRTGWNGGYGTYVVIDHANGTQTLYAHNSQNTVSVGQSVEQGQVIAYMGSTGRSTGNHVHFEVRGATNPFASCGLRTQCR
ncbi:MAG: peptidoglycan DD-metalloendopeptidase family protein [Candidatus Paceibacterota bacterium]